MESGAAVLCANRKRGRGGRFLTYGESLTAPELRRGFRCPLRSWPRPYTGKPVPGSGPPKPVSGGGSALRFLKARRGGAVVLLVDLDANLAALSRWREIARVGAAHAALLVSGGPQARLRSARRSARSPSSTKRREIAPGRDIDVPIGSSAGSPQVLRRPRRRRRDRMRPWRAPSPPGSLLIRGF
jgi:hypothetical protein